MCNFEVFYPGIILAHPEETESTAPCITLEKKTSPAPLNSFSEILWINN